MMESGGQPMVLLTRTENDNQRMELEFHQRGIESISLSLIGIRTITPDLSRLPSTGSRATVLLTSRTATRAWLDLREEDPGIGSIEIVNYLIVGRRSAAILISRKPDAKILALANSVEELLEDLAELSQQTGRLASRMKPMPLLYPCSRLRRDEAVSGLGALRYEVIEIPIYEPYLPSHSTRDLPKILEALSPNAYLTFFSPSAVNNFFDALRGSEVRPGKDLRYAAIGSTTAEALYAAGVEDVLIPERPEVNLFVRMLAEEIGST